MIRVAVLDHGMGNLRSVAKALEAAGATAFVTTALADTLSGDALCVPGQGIFGRCMERVGALGLAEPIEEWIAAGRPYLGICLGMQILFEASEESAEVGLGILGGHVKRLPDDVRVPHIGWNTVSGTDAIPRFFYFDHSYAVHPADDSIVKGWTEHGHRFAALIETGSICGVQFHPEKSSTDGIGLLKEWVTSL